LAFDFDEVLAFYVGRRLFEPLAGTPFWEASLRAFQKIRTTFTPRALEYLETFSALFPSTRSGAQDDSHRDDTIWTVQTGVEGRTVARLEYHPEQATEPAMRDVHPLAWVFHRGAMHLLAVNPEVGKDYRPCLWKDYRPCL
jgi:predicted DNA-binding transcriptional regulator YafY